MLLRRMNDNDLFNSLHNMQRIQNQLNRLLSLNMAEPSPEFPPLNVWVSETGAIINAEIPGIEPEDLDISIVNDTLTIRGTLSAQAQKDGENCQRQERGCGQFTRSIKLPFGVEIEKVDAKVSEGILSISLPRAEAEKPRKIEVISH